MNIQAKPSKRKQLARKSSTPKMAVPKPDVRVIKLAVLAVGGQGGGVLGNWIVDLAQENGYVAQSTSVAGVAQRTGATIYYIEMMPDEGRDPVFALSPAPGDVDILIAAELMEAGRAIMRGFVTPGQTALIASTHRALAVSEKVVPGDGISQSADVMDAARKASRRLITFDMDAVAVAQGSVISASAFGALCGSKELPFTRAQFEETIRRSGRGVETSLKAFAVACKRAESGEEDTPASKALAPSRSTNIPAGPDADVAAWERLVARVEALPEPVIHMASNGLAKVVDFQDVAYGTEYLDRLDGVLAIDRNAGGKTNRKGFALTVASAKHIANAMVYDDVIRVADIKTRASRTERVKDEVRPPNGAVMHVTEYMHPRADEVCGILPARLGAAIEARPMAFKLVDKIVNRGRRVRTDGIFWFTVLYCLAGLRRFRRSLYRHEIEKKHLEQWLDFALPLAPENYQLAVEAINTRRLVKGYSDTHARGLSKFDRVIDGIKLVQGRKDAADWARRLREAALADEKGKALDGAIETIRSFASNG